MASKSELVLATDSRVSAIRTIDCREPLVALSEACPTVCLDTSSKNAAWLGYDPDFRLRIGVAERLNAAQQRLPSGYTLLLKECFRRIEVQRRFYEDYLAELRVEYPDANDDEIAIEASKYVAPPWMSGHPTGSAVDVTLVDERNRELDMGTAYDADPISSQSACYTDAQDISEAARRNRSLLIVAMEASGFVNYPTEWWHWSYGDQYWAFITSSHQAIYGPV